MEEKINSSSNVLGPILLKSLGIQEENCIKAVITLESGCSIIIDATYESIKVNSDGIKELKDTIKHFKIKEKAL